MVILCAAASSVTTTLFVLNVKLGASFTAVTVTVKVVVFVEGASSVTVTVISAVPLALATGP